MKEMLKIKQTGAWTIFLFVLAVSAMLAANAQAFTVNVVDPNGVPVPGFRWLLEEDNTNVTVPGVPVRVSIGTDIHNSHAPLVNKGTEATATADIEFDVNGTALPDIRYVVSILPDAGFSNSGTVIEPGQGAVTVTVNPLPIPTAQISLFAFVDNNPINNVFDEHDLGLGGASIIVSDNAGPVSQDAFGNPLGTQYDRTCDDTYAPGTTGTGTFPCVDPVDGPVITVRGNGVITTLTQEQFDAGGASNPYNLKVGEALIKYLVPGKYGIVVVPPGADDNGSPITWSQTSTIEGTPTVDAWVKANEPKLFVEGFGTGFNHVFYGFVKVSPLTPSPFKGQTFTALEWNETPPAGATGTITGTLRMNHFSKPPNLQGFYPGVPVANCWVGLNDPLVRPGLLLGEAGKYAAPCNADSSFTINNVPPGTYQLVTWDTYLDTLFGIHSVTVPPGASGTGGTVDLGDVLTFRWFGTLNNYVFFDTNENGFRDPGEPGIPEQNVNLRFRDGTIYQAFPTDLDGFVPFDEVFPFFKWLVVEVDFARFKATGMTTAVDDGGAIPGPAWPANGNKNPQPQPENGGADYRTETGPVLTQAMHLFLGQTNLIEWGKSHYADGENGGVSGVVFYAITRAENDPRYAAAEEWEPGVPRVQVNLYQDIVDISGGCPGVVGSDKLIDDVDGSDPVTCLATLADVDNYPFQWAPMYSGEAGWTGTPGPEDIDDGNTGVDIGLGNGTFDAGDAIQITTTDSWDDNKPSGCVQDLPVLPGLGAINECADGFGTWNQVRPGLFDGGYAFDSYYPGGIDSGSTETDGLPSAFYIVEAVTPPGYELLKEEDKNVDFGDEYIPSTLLLPAECVGADHPVPATLSFDNTTPAPFALTTRPLCDRKLVSLSQGQNAAADFFVFTQVPKAARSVGFVNNDLGAEFNQASPVYGEKLAASWLPASFRDWKGQELVRVYTDEWGSYNAMLPSTYTVNVPSPTGVSPSMITVVLNDPFFADGTPDPFHDPDYAVTPWTFNYMPGATSYLDTPIVPVTAFTANERRIDTGPFNGTPVIYSASTAGLPGPDTQAGPLFCTDTSPGDATNYGTITINAPPGGFVDVRNPDYPTFSTDPTIQREVGFGVVQGPNGAVTLDGVPLNIDSWTNTQIVADVPDTATTGQLMVIRDNGSSVATAEIGLTLNIMDCSGLTVHTVAAAPWPATPIQVAVDAAVAGDIIIVSPGSYNENVIVDKPVWLQGSGAGTKINANPIPLERIDLWHARLETDAFGGQRFVDFLLKNPLSASETPAFFVVGETIFPTGNLQNVGAGTQFLNPGNPFPGPGQPGIDGFQIFGSKAGGGIFALSGVRDMIISNNEMINNQGNYGGGIAVGTPDSGFPADALDVSLNYGMIIRNNKIHRNGGIQGAGGIGMNEGSEGYLIENNIITGNFGRFNGGGIQHRGFSAGDNIIRSNRIIFNEVFFGVILAVAGDGAGIFIGGDVAGGTGAGNVTIDANLIQGNMTGAGNGGGIRAFALNGDDVRDSPLDDTSWYTLNIFNNIIVNNIAGNSGAGISLQDAPRVNIVNNTIARNDSTATSVLNFEVGQANSTPTPAGVASNLHSTILYDLISPMAYPNYSDPLLVNNIIRQNRSFYNDASLNSGAGGLAPNPAGPYWDIHVIGAVSAADPHLNPDYCMLTSLTDPATGFDYTLGGTDTTNNTSNPAFLAPYFNFIESATVVDEGGNAINLRFTPVLSAGTDYHVGAGFGWEAGTNSYIGTFSELALDIDSELRPFGAGISDIGADELQALPAAPAGLTGGVKGVTAQVTEVVQTNLQTGSLSGVSATLPGSLATGENGSLLDRAKETLAGVIDALVPERNQSGGSGTGLGESATMSPETSDLIGKENETLSSAIRRSPVVSTEQNDPVEMNLRLPGNNAENVLQDSSRVVEGAENTLKTSLAPLQESSGVVRDIGQQAPAQASISANMSESVLSEAKGKEPGSGAVTVMTVTGQDEGSGSALFKYSLIGLLLVGLVLISFVIFLPRAKQDREQQKRGEI